jgi:transcriptional regulator with XRE-family HTH domain
MPPERTTLGSVLAVARKDLKLSLKDVAGKVKKDDGSPISPQYLNDIEHDRRIPAAEVLEGLAKAMKLAPDYLYFLAGSMPADLKKRVVREDEVVEAYRLFRKRLG